MLRNTDTYRNHLNEEGNPYKKIRMKETLYKKTWQRKKQTVGGGLK
jgi:hypothetical protein